MPCLCTGVRASFAGHVGLLAWEPKLPGPETVGQDQVVPICELQTDIYVNIFSDWLRILWKSQRKNLGPLILSPCSNKGVINITGFYYFQFQLPYEAGGATVLVRILFSACQLSKWSPKTVWLTFIYKRKFFLPTHTCVFFKMCLYSEKRPSKNCILSLNWSIPCLYFYPVYLVLK